MPRVICPTSALFMVVVSCECEGFSHSRDRPGWRQRPEARRCCVAKRILGFSGLLIGPDRGRWASTVGEAKTKRHDQTERPGFRRRKVSPPELVPAGCLRHAVVGRAVSSCRRRSSFKAPGSQLGATAGLEARAATCRTGVRVRHRARAALRQAPVAAVDYLEESPAAACSHR